MDKEYIQKTVMLKLVGLCYKFRLSKVQILFIWVSELTKIVTERPQLFTKTKMLGFNFSFD